MDKFKSLILIGAASLLTFGGFAASPVLADNHEDYRVNQQHQKTRLQEIRYPQEIRRQRETRRPQEIRRQQEIRRLQEARREEEANRVHRY
jgi:hypothetical protein